MKFYKYSTGDFVMRHKIIDKSLKNLTELNLVVTILHSQSPMKKPKLSLTYNIIVHICSNLA